MQRSRAILAGYRRDDCADPEGYVLQIGAILEHYDDGVIDAVSHPFTGIQTKLKWPPNPSELKEACEEERDRRARMRRYGAMPKFTRVAYVKDDRPGRRANVLVRSDAPQYAHVYEWIKTADKADWCADKQGCGIWVNWMAIGLTARPVTGFQRIGAAAVHAGEPGAA